MVTKTINNIRSRLRGATIKCYECSELNYIKMNCPKLRSKKNKDDKALTCRSQFKIDPNKKRNYRRAVNKIISTLDEIVLSDDDSESDDEGNDKKVKEVDFTGMCFMANSEELNDDDLYSDPNEHADIISFLKKMKHHAWCSITHAMPAHTTWKERNARIFQSDQVQDVPGAALGHQRGGEELWIWTAGFFKMSEPSPA